MRTAIDRTKSLLRNQEAVAVTEYAAMLALVTLLSVIAITAIGTKAAAAFTVVMTCLR